MNKFLLKNWFRLTVSFLLLIIALSVFYFCVASPHYKEKKKKECFSNAYKNSTGVLDYDSLKKISSLCDTYLYETVMKK